MNIEQIKQKYEELEELKSKLFDYFGIPEDEDLRMESFDFEFHDCFWKKNKKNILVANSKEELNIYGDDCESLELYNSWYNQTIYQSQKYTMAICELNDEVVIYVLDNSKETK